MTLNRAFVVGVALVMAACGGTALDTDRGLPESVPDAIPVPPEAEIGAIDVDQETARTSVEMTVPGGLQDTVQFFSIGLVSNGFVVDESTGRDGGWSLVFSRGDIRGALDLSGPEAGPVVVRLVLNTA